MSRLARTTAAAMLALGLAAGVARAETRDEFLAKLESELLAVGQRTSKRPGEGASTGPDVTVIYLTDVSNYTPGGSEGGYRGYSLGTTSCNVGTEPVAWCDDAGGCGGGLGDEDHPVIAQNLYRLKDGSFQQIGMSWLKHGFVSTNSPDANCGSCQQPPLGGDQLGVGCTDTYGSFLNGDRDLGRRSEVNATTGAFPFPHGDACDDFGGNPCPTESEQRIKVLETDLDPALTGGARYGMAGQSVAGDDAREDNGLNNASYRRATVGSMPQLTISLPQAEPTIRELSALHAWRAEDPGVEIVNVDLATAFGPVQRFEAARRVTAAEGGGYHTEVAIRNPNSDRSARALRVDFAAPTAIAGVGFHDIDHHSGEPYDTEDWAAAVDGGAGTVEWFTDLFADNENANALRWATTFTFWFDSDRPPEEASYELELFTPGSPTTVEIPFLGAVIFEDGFESGGTGNWDQTVN